MSDRAGRDFRAVDVAYDALDVLVLSVDLLHPEDVVTEVEALEAALLPEQGDHHAAGPVEALPEELSGKMWSFKTRSWD